MAEAVTFSIVKNLIPKLTSIADCEIGLMYNSDELKKLKGTLSIIKDLIVDAEEFQEKSQFLRNRIKTLGEALFDADDLLDEMATEDYRRRLDTRGKMARQVCNFFSPSNNHLDFRRKMGHAINEIGDRLDLVANDIYKLNLISNRVIVITQVSGNRKIETPIGGNRERETDSFVFRPAIFGREKEKNEIIEMLFSPGSNTNSVSPMIIPIVGMGGLGKTTLAKLVFNDERVVKHFYPRSWVCVSEDFNSKLIVMNILMSISDDIVDGMDMEQLQSLLRRKLEGKRYLLVLDDVWNESRRSWKELERRLMIGASGCKILVTTRSVKVASAMGIETPYILNGLSDVEEPEKLFNQIAQGNRMRPSSYDVDILSVLELSYDMLPTHLKYCFAYCSIFPKDYKIKYEELIQLWMAQGYIQSSSSSERSLESIGDQYFKDLLSASFFQEVEFDDYHSITSFKMHDLIHDLAQQVIGTNYVRVPHMSLQDDLKELPRLEEKGTRTFFLPGGLHDLKMDDFNQGTIISKLTYLRVLDLRYCGIEKVHDSIGLLKHLRYLNLSRNRGIDLLPDSISNLLNLQTLNLSGCGGLRELPRSIKKLCRLRYLMMDGCDQLTHMPVGMGRLTSLQKLSLIVIGEKKRKKGISQPRCSLRDLKDLNDLRGELSIRNLGMIGVEDAAEESKEANMKRKTYLQSLELLWERGQNTEIEQMVAELVLEGLQPHSDLKELSIRRYCGVKFPSWMRMMLNLVKLTFKNCDNCQQLQSLDQFRFLKFLYIDDLENLEYIQEKDFHNNNNQATLLFFPSLQVLELRKMPKLKGWWRRGESLSSSSMTEIAAGEEDQEEETHASPSSLEFPSLTKLSILYCPMLTSMPLHPNLEELELSDATGKLLRERLTTTSKISSSSSSSPVPKLKSLCIVDLKDLDAMPREWQKNLTSLESLMIDGHNKLERKESFKGGEFDNEETASDSKGKGLLVEAFDEIEVDG